MASYCGLSCYDNMIRDGQYEGIQHAAVDMSTLVDMFAILLRTREFSFSPSAL